MTETNKSIDTSNSTGDQSTANAGKFLDKHSSLKELSDSLRNSHSENTGQKIRAFRRELTMSLNIFMLLINSYGIVIHSQSEQKMLLLSYIISTVALIPTLFLLIANNRPIEKIAAFMGCVSLFTLLSHQAALGLDSVTHYIVAPAFIASCCVFFSGRMVYLSSGIVLASICYGLYRISASNIQIITIDTANIGETLAPAAIISALIVLYTFSRYRSVAKKSVEISLRAKSNLKRANNVLEEMLKWQQLNTRSQIKLQHVGKMSGWWLDVNTRSLAVSFRTANDEYEVVHTQLNRNFKLDRQGIEDLKNAKYLSFWQNVIEPELSAAIDAKQGWDHEHQTQLEDGSSLWLRSIGEVELGEKGVDYVFGVVQNNTETKILTQQLEYQANYDDLTKLHNRRSLEASLQNKIANPTKNSLFYLFVDLDRFKAVNDTSGHLAGDELLRVVSKIIRENLRKSDIAGRIGGDEFGILLEGCNLDSAISIADRIRSDIDSLVFNWEGDQHRIGASIGAVEVDESIHSIDQLQLLADSACLEAKSEGRNRVKLCDKNNTSAENRKDSSRWLQRLQEAIHNDNFALCVQEIKPVTNESTSHSSSIGHQEGRKAVEVLIRMRASDGNGLIAPGAFLPIAERYNLCTQIDHWVVKQVLDIALEQYASSPATTDAFWINLSGQSVSDDDFCSQIYDLLRAANLPAGTINFEITETAVIRDINNAVAFMRQLKSIGCSFALDDFGSGLASFGYLKQLPVDVIKIDGLFIKEINQGNLDRVFTKSIIDVAHAIGIQTVAEFVENDLIVQAVTELGIDYVQGFGIHRPEEIALSADATLIAEQTKKAG